MMHNSLLIADRLAKANGDEISRSRRDPHRNVRAWDRNAAIGADEVRLTGGWSVRTEGNLPGMEEAQADLTDYLKRFGLVVDDNQPGLFLLREDRVIAGGAFRREAGEGRVILYASDTKGPWAAVVYLEKELSVRGAPAICRGTIERRPSWEVQMGQAPYGANYLVPDLDAAYLSDDAFRLMVHYGINGLTIYGDWLFYVKSEIFPDLNHPDYERNIGILKETAARAGKFGISLYYVPVSPKLDSNHPLFAKLPSAKGARIFPGLQPSDKHIHNLCSSDPLSLAFHGETMAGLFKAVPELGGLILIIGGESYYHCFMRPDLTGLEQGERTNCPRCLGKTPEEAVNALLKVTADAVHGVKREAPVMAWPYSAFIWSSDPAQIELLQGMSPEVALLSTIEKDEWVQKEGYRKHIWDYSVDYIGPASNLLQQADAAKERDIRLYVKTETAIGLECIHIPYMPALDRLAAKWSEVAKLRPAGVLQSWMFFGMWGSRAEELGWWTNWKPEIPHSDVIRMMAERDLGGHASAYIRAWTQMSGAVSHLPYIPYYFTGPEFIGPAHPLVFGEEPEHKTRYEALLYYLQENEETFSDVVNEVKHSLVLTEMPYAHMREGMEADEGRDLSDILIAEYAVACDLARRAYEEVDRLTPDDGKQTAELEAEERLLIEFVYRTLLTALHTYRFLVAKERGDLAAMKQTAQVELLNARKAVPLLRQAPWLDLSRRNDGDFPSSMVMLESKIASLEEELGRLT